MTTDPTLLRRRTLNAVLLALALPLGSQLAPQASGAAEIDATDADGARLKSAIDGPQRSAANRARDAARHPFETLRFFGLTPADTVIEIAPGGGWYTEILAPYLRDHGRLYAAHEAADAPDEGARKARARFAAKLAANPEAYGRVVLGTLPGSMPNTTGFSDIAPPGGADRVLTFRNIHNWIETGQLDAMLRAFFAVLKPGGVFGVEEHRAPAGTPLPRIIETGYVPEAFIIEHARAAGFEFTAGSEVNANPRDDKNHANGVWSLPPTLRGGDADRAKFLAIGESDRMTLKFIKPIH